MTPLDEAHSRAAAAEDDQAALMRYYAILSGAEIYLLLEREAGDGTAEPRVVDPGTGPLALGFDLELRLAEFAGGAAPYVALSGRQAAEMLSGAGLGLALNLDQPSETVLDSETLAWLAGVEAGGEAREAQLSKVHSPHGVPADLLEAIDRKLATATGFADHAILVDAEYSDGGSGHLLVVFDCVPPAQAPLANAIGEAMAFQGFGAGWLDIAFFDSGSEIAKRIGKVGLRFDLPQASAGEPKAPGMDPDSPPKLR